MRKTEGGQIVERGEEIRRIISWGRGLAEREF